MANPVADMPSAKVFEASSPIHENVSWFQRRSVFWDAAGIFLALKSKGDNFGLCVRGRAEALDQFGKGQVFGRAWQGCRGN